MVNDTGRRARNRAARHHQLIEAAGAIVTDEGFANLTMQGLADRVDCAVGTIYTYFNSKSALLAALQANAMRVLSASYDAAADQWDLALENADIEERPAALTRMLAFANLFVEWPVLHPREFDFLQMLISSRDEVISDADRVTVIPNALLLLAEVQVQINAATEIGALRMDPDRPGDDSLSRTLRLVGAIDGAVLVSATGPLVPDLDPDAFDLRQMAFRVTSDMLIAWGATEEDRAVANDALMMLERRGVLLPGGGN